MLPKNDVALLVENGPFYTDVDTIRSAIVAEERRLEAILNSETLRHFSRRIEYWDLLIRVLKSGGNNSVGLNDIALLCKSGTMHPHSLTKFLRETISAGLVYTEEGNPRDKKVVRASAQLITDFVSLTQQ